MKNKQSNIIVPARNEKCNIEGIIQRIPDFYGAKKEIIFVEGHSQDGTWEEIQRVQFFFKTEKISSFQQTGKGKIDAVRLGFNKANNELLIILDADLTMPPELLLRFYDCYINGLGEFINGSRLVARWNLER